MACNDSGSVEVQQPQQADNEPALSHKKSKRPSKWDTTSEIPLLSSPQVAHSCGALLVVTDDQRCPTIQGCLKKAMNHYEWLALISKLCMVSQLQVESAHCPQIARRNNQLLLLLFCVAQCLVPVKSIAPMHALNQSCQK